MTEEKMNKEEINQENSCSNKNCTCESCDCEKDGNECTCGTTCDCKEGSECNCEDECDCDDCTCGCSEEKCSENCTCTSNEENSKIEELTKEIAHLTEENKALLNKAQTAQAEMINFRRRKEEEYLTKSKYANQDLITEIIPIVDNFERAIKFDDNDLTDELSKFLDGFKMMYSQLTTILRNFGVEEISRKGEIFDPNQEEALMSDSLEGYKDDEVLEVLLKGYKLKDRVIRPATVKVNKINK